jgi:rubredoxin
MKEFFRKIQPLWEQGALRGRPACVFTASGKFHGGAETALLSLMFPLFAHGMIMVGLPPFPRSYISDGCFLGVKALIDRSKTDEPDEDTATAAKLLGERLARTVLALVCGRDSVKQFIVDEQKTSNRLPSAKHAADDVKALLKDGDVEAWQCLNCGYVHNGEVPPGQCPVCNLGVEYFTAYDVDAWECTSCGYVVYSARPVEQCPVCKASHDGFMPYKG